MSRISAKTKSNPSKAKLKPHSGIRMVVGLSIDVHNLPKKLQKELCHEFIQDLDKGIIA